MRSIAILSTLSLLVACGAPAPSGDSAPETATLRSLDGASTALAELSMTAWSSGALEITLTPTALASGEYALSVYDFGSCAIVREKANNPVLGATGTSSVLPLAGTTDLQVSGTSPVSAVIGVSALRKDLDALSSRPIALKNSDGKLVACGEVSNAATVAR